MFKRVYPVVGFASAKSLKSAWLVSDLPPHLLVAKANRRVIRPGNILSAHFTWGVVCSLSFVISNQIIFSRQNQQWLRAAATLQSDLNHPRMPSLKASNLLVWVPKTGQRVHGHASTSVLILTPEAALMLCSIYLRSWKSELGMASHTSRLSSRATSALVRLIMLAILVYNSALCCILPT